jgi:hypothetical protein
MFFTASRGLKSEPTVPEHTEAHTHTHTHTHTLVLLHEKTICEEIKDILRPESWQYYCTTWQLQQSKRALLPHATYFTLAKQFSTAFGINCF